MLGSLGYICLNVTSVGAKILLSVIIGLILLILSAAYFPGFVAFVQNIAGAVAQFITNDIGTPVEYNIWFKLFFSEQQLVVIFFIILARLLMAIIGTVCWHIMFGNVR